MILALFALLLVRPAAAAWECPSPYWELRLQEAPGFEFKPAYCQAERQWTETVKVGKDKKVRVHVEGEDPSAVNVPGRSVEVRFSERILIGTGKPWDEVNADDNWPCGDRLLKPSAPQEGRHLGYRTVRYDCREQDASGFRRRQVFWLDDHLVKMTVLVSYEFSVGLENYQDKKWVRRLAKIREPHQPLFDQALAALKPKQGTAAPVEKPKKKEPEPKPEPKKESGPIPLLR